MRPTNLLLITTFAQRCGVSPRTLRLYDQLGLLRPAGRDPRTCYRYYRPEQASVCAQIQYFKACGATLRQIKAVLGVSNRQDDGTRLLRRLRSANLSAIDVAQRSLAWIEEALDTDGAEPGRPLYVTVRQCPASFVVSVRVTISRYEEIHSHEQALRESLPSTVPIGEVGVLWHQCADRAAIEGEPFITLRGQRRPTGARQLPAVRVASVFSTLDDHDAEAKYVGLSRWMHARGHALVGPRREVYRGSLLEIQYPLGMI